MNLKKLNIIGTLLVGLFSISNVNAGYIVVNNDEWTFSNSGYAHAGVNTANESNAHNFIRNLTSLFAGDSSGNFLAFTSNFGVNQPSLANSMNTLGHTWTQYGENTPTTDFGNYDAIFLGGYYGFNQQDVIDYVAQGGNAYIMAGTGSGGAVNEANFWAPILAEVGLAFEPSYNGISGTSTPTVDPLTKDVDGLYFSHGNSIVDLDPNNDTTNGEILFSLGNEGMLAIGSFGAMPTNSQYTPNNVVNASAPGALGLFVIALGLLAGRRRAK